MAFTKLLVTVDFSAHSGRALQLGIKLAEICQARVEVVYVLEYGDLAEAEGLLTEFVASWTHGAAIEATVLQGTGAYAVLQSVARSDVDLIVCGSQGKTGLKRLWLGSFAEKLVRMAALPVLVVRQPTPDRALHRVLVADDLTPAFSRVRAVVGELWEQLQRSEQAEEVSMLALYVAGALSPRDEAEAGPKLRECYPGFNTHVAVGRPAPAILEVAAAREVDLIICGAHGKHGLPHFFVGSVAETLVRQATCSVMTVPEVREGEEAALWEEGAADAASRRLELEHGP